METTQRLWMKRMESLESEGLYLIPVSRRQMINRGRVDGGEERGPRWATVPCGDSLKELDQPTSQARTSPVTRTSRGTERTRLLDDTSASGSGPVQQQHQRKNQESPLLRAKSN